MTDIAGAVDEARRTLHKLADLWHELWSQQYDQPWRREQATIPSPNVGDTVHHTGTPGPLQNYYLQAQRAIRDAWRTIGGTWKQPPSRWDTSTVPPDVMRRLTLLLADELHRSDLDNGVALKAAMRIQGGWNALPAGIRGEAKGGARRRCVYCTDPAEPSRNKCGRHKYAANQPTPGSAA